MFYNFPHLMKHLRSSNLRVTYWTAKAYRTSLPGSNSNEANIFIIGAGLAGLTAAKYLRKNNFKNIRILEASNRYGGRIRTTKFGEISVELGNNRISITRETLSFLDEILNIDSLKRLDIEPIFIKSDGEFIPFDLKQNVIKTFNYILNEIEEKFNSVNSKKIKNGKQYLENKIKEKSKILYGNDSQIASLVYQALMSDLQSFYGCDMSYVHIENLRNLLNIYTNSSLLGHEMIATLQPLIKDLQDIIHYNKPVVKINSYTGEINCIDGTKYIADHIISTIPLGHLKAYQSFLFEPELSDMKLKSINKLGIGTPENVFIKYNGNLDDLLPDKHIIYPVWNSNENLYSNDIYKNITAIYRLPESRNILQIHCKDNEFHRNEEIILHNLDKFLKCFTRKSLQLNLIEILKSDWSTDPKFLGGIPYLMDANSKRYVNALASPIYWRMPDNEIIPVLMFAGDATVLNGFGTLEGAAKSGLREGKRLVEYYLQKHN
ncbi:protein anon-37Cs [Condylostylus longicornis]|uniref:protein anon-37Cs n=1 Tax=Condylostylus longicornis TaxID=2530218 RepID=UPI00244E1091|nr:protein anon-37Cs [Condylostylus longicornis]